MPLTLRAANSPTGLRCDLLKHPEQTVISARTPKLGWIYNPSFRNDSQKAYRVIVASSEALAKAGKGSIWDSGVVSNSTSINLSCGGTTLQPGTNYFWRVQTVDSKGQLSPFSRIQQFNTAAQLTEPLNSSGVTYQLPANNSVNCYPLRFVDAPPILVTNTAPGRWFIDFGQDAFGYATVHMNGSFHGARCQVHFGEMASGYAVNTSPPGNVRYGAITDSLRNGDVILSFRPPTDRATINPPASYGNVMPFRYLELTNFPGTVTMTDVVQKRLVSEFDPHAASFISSSPTLNQVWNLCHRSMQWLTFDGIYVDGDRERKPYEADTFIQQISSYAVENEFTMPRCSFEYLISHPTWPTEWKFHMVFIAWEDYLHTGNTDLLLKYYNDLVADCFTNRARSDGLIQGFQQGGSSGDIIDWPAGDRDGFVWESYNSVINAFYYRCMRNMTQIAQITGHESDATNFANRANQVYNSFNSVFWNPNTRSYIDGIGTSHSSAHANFFPLAFGLVPAGNEAAVVNYIHSRIAAKGGMPCSVYGAQYLLDGLFQAGDADTALDLISTNGPRSWMNMINLGSTLTTEAWSFADKPNEDWNHAWGAAAGNLIVRYVLGVQPLAAGFGQIRIQPHLGDTLSYVRGVIPTIRGSVSIQVTNAPALCRMFVNIPGNVTAKVMLPAHSFTNAVALVDGAVVSGSLLNGWLTITNIGSGHHAIWLNTNNAASQAMLYNNWMAGWFGTVAGKPATAGSLTKPDGNGTNDLNGFIAGANPLDAAGRSRVRRSEF